MLTRMKARRILQITWRGLVAIPLVASSWAPGWGHPISDALTAASVSTHMHSAQTHSSTPDSDGVPCDGMQASTDVTDNPASTLETAAADGGEGCADHCCPAAHCAPAACISFAAAWIVVAVLDPLEIASADAPPVWRAPVPPRPPPVEQLRPPIA